jgi:purine catabolism regulator
MVVQKNAYTDAEQGCVLTDYFYGRFPDKKSFANRLASTVVRSNSEYLVAIYDTEHYNVHDYFSEELKNHIQDSFPRSIPVIYENDLIVLIDVGKDNKIMHTYQDRAREFLREHHLRVGFSDAFTDAYALEEYRRQAKKALLFSRLQTHRLCAMYDEYKLYDLLMRAKQGNGLEKFIANGCGAIIDYDLANSTEYLKTAFFYIYFMKNLKQVADALVVHKNTISYRINKMKELFTLDLENAETRAGVFHSYILRQLLEKPELIEKYEQI